MFWKFVKAAWGAKFGMPVPLNWFILAFVGVLAYLNIAFLVIGAGIELGYLLFLANSKSFQNMLAKTEADKAKADAMSEIGRQVTKLSEEDHCRYLDLVNRCQTIVEQQRHETPPATLEDQAQGLSRLAGVYLQLLVTKTAIENNPGEQPSVLQKQVKSVEKRLSDPDISDETKKSFLSQLDILHQRVKARMETNDRLEFIDAELERIEQQIELLREQTVADTDPSIVSGKIDAVTSTLTGTNDWIKDHKALFGSMDDVWSSPPPVVQVAQEA